MHCHKGYAYELYVLLMTVEVWRLDISTKNNLRLDDAAVQESVTTVGAPFLSPKSPLFKLRILFGTGPKAP